MLKEIITKLKKLEFNTKRNYFLILFVVYIYFQQSNWSENSILQKIVMNIALFCCFIFSQLLVEHNSRS